MGFCFGIIVARTLASEICERRKGLYFGEEGGGASFWNVTVMEPKDNEK